MNRYNLEWELRTLRRRWVVQHVFGTVTGVAKDNIVQFEPGAAKINDSPWGTLNNNYDAGLDKVTGTGGGNNIELQRAICLYCTVAGTDTAWVALQRPVTNDLYTREWKLVKQWTMVANDTAGIPIPPAPNTTVTFDGAGNGTSSNISVTGITGFWGENCNLTASSDTVAAQRKSDRVGLTIVRRVGVFCKVGMSGANSWIAVEG